MGFDSAFKLVILILLGIGNCSVGLCQDAKDKYQENVPVDQVKALGEARQKRIGGQTDLAISSLSNLIKKNPTYYSAQYNLGLAYLDKKEYDLSIVALENAANIKRTSPAITDASIFNSLGWAYMLKGNSAKAEETFREGEKNLGSLSDDSKRRLLTNMGWLYMNTGRLDEAEKYLRIVDRNYNSSFSQENLKVIESVKSQRKVQ